MPANTVTSVLSPGSWHRPSFLPTLFCSTPPTLCVAIHLSLLLYLIVHLSCNSSAVSRCLILTASLPQKSHASIFQLLNLRSPPTRVRAPLTTSKTKPSATALQRSWPSGLGPSPCLARPRLPAAAVVLFRTQKRLCRIPSTSQNPSNHQQNTNKQLASSRSTRSNVVYVSITQPTGFPSTSFRVLPPNQNRRLFLAFKRHIIISTLARLAPIRY